MNCTPTGCTGECNSGRKCEDSFRATRASYGLDPDSDDLGRLPLLFVLWIIATGLVYGLTGWAW